MKVLHKSGDWSLGILDDKNFVVSKIDKYEEEGKEKYRMRETKYFSDLAGAWRRLVKLRSMEECSDVASYVTKYVEHASAFDRVGV